MSSVGAVDDPIAILREALSAAKRAVVFTGAGVSTECGIPDYRSPGGIWTRYRPVDFDDFLASEEKRRLFWDRKFATHGTIEAAVPGRGHRAIAALAARGPVETVITQNVDGLHQRAGIPEERLVEIHGNTTYARCLDCGRRHELAPIRQAFLAHGRLPVCDACGGLVKTATISFGQAMPAAEMRRAEAASLACDLFLTVGSSLRVRPAAGLPLLARRGGARLIIVNREPTALDGAADAVVHGEIGPLLGAVADVA